MGMPYEPKPIGGIKVPANGTKFFDFPFPSRAMIYKIVVQQVGGGVGTDFTVELFNSERAAQGFSESDTEGDDTGGLPASMYRITPPLAGVGGRYAYFNEAGSGYPFVSQDAGTLGLGRKVWIKISNLSGTEKTYAVALGGFGSDPG